MHIKLEVLFLVHCVFASVTLKEVSYLSPDFVNLQMIILKFYPNQTRPFKANDVKLVSSGQVATSLMVHHPVINSCVSLGCFFQNASPLNDVITW